ncbi:MAG: hypothetical protein DMD54_11640 [Gemmatimonadetes bacterium]|nr:MAG: hypothetical protein DMD54_11640 [Gemmatimonadota bacterium]
MTVTNKLVLAALGIAVFVSCEKVVAPGSISQFALSPNSVTLQANQIEDFTAVGYTSTGDSADVAVTWTATGGTVDATDNGRRHYGHYHSAACGVFHVVATSHPGNLSDSAIVTVAGCNVSVASVAVSPSSGTVAVNQSVHLSATPKDANGNALFGRAIAWSSSNTSVAVADVNGNVTGLAPGSAAITATSEGQSGTAAITVTDVAVASVAVSPASASVAAGSTVQLTATPKDANGNTLSGRVVTWSSSNTAAAVVNASGLVTGIAAGSATITATSETKTGTAAITVTAVPVASVSVSPASASVAAGNTVQLTATPKDANGNTLSGRVVTWSSDNTAAATVNASGLVTGIAAGSATITATSEGHSGTAAITVTASSGGLCTTSTTSFQNAAFDVQSGSFTAAFDATPNGAGIDALTGLSQGAAATYTDLAVIVRFNSSGAIDARNGGAYAADNAIPYSSGTSYHFRVVVDVSSHTYSVYVTPSGGSEQTVGSGYAFRSEQSAVTSLGNWTLTALSGAHTVCNFGITGSAPPAPVATVSVSPASATINDGQTQQLSATPRDSNGTQLYGRVVTWSSNNTAAATVSSSGLVSGIAAGSATITATSEGKNGTSAITVVHMPVASLTVTPASASVSAGSTVQLTATPRDANGNALVGRTVTWSSNTTAAATVNGSGLVTGVAAGSATITATSEGQSGTSAVTVTPPGTSQFGHVFIVTEENTDYASVTSSNMPYLMGLAAQYGLATQYYANTHPSIGNYFELATGQVLTNDDGSSVIENVPNIVRSLVSAGKTWKSYAESIPNACFLGGDTGNYARKHNVFALLSDVANDPTGQACNIVPFTQFATDLASGTLPAFSNIVPDLCNDAHDCSLTTADTWLRTNIGPLLANATFQQDGLLIIVFDESGGDNANGGGRIVWVAVSSKSKPGYQSTTLYQHPSTLRLILKALGVTSYPGAAATAPDMSEFFNP